MLFINKILLATTFLAWNTDAHGYLKSPRSRNFVAFEDGKESGGTVTDPAPEYCPQCLNRGGPLAACGLTGGHNYDSPPNSIGGTLASNIQETFSVGSQIDVDVVLTAHHMGHFEFHACPITEGDIPTQECFHSNPVEVVQDVLYGAPTDPNYPNRAYIPPLTYSGIINESNGVPGTLYRYKLQLPSDLEGELVLLQWYYLTANSCIHPGYDEYPFPAAWGGDLPGSTGLCVFDDSDGGSGVPERFWNCAEISLTSGPVAPTTPAPVPAPSAPITNPPYANPVAPVGAPVAVPTGNGVGCGNGVVGNGICANVELCCSEFGYCGTGTAWCGNTPEAPIASLGPTTSPVPSRAPTTRAPTIANAGCESVPEAMEVNFGYFQSWAKWRSASCNTVIAADIDVDGNGYTHLAYSFAGIDANGMLAPWLDDYIEEVQQFADFNAIKASFPNLRTMIAVGGWTFNDPGPTQSRFSTVASAASSRAVFAASVVDFLRLHNFDGIDFDWEYPVDSGRGGQPQDKQNYALLVQAVRDAFDAAPEDFQITMAIPISTSKLSSGYDVPALTGSLDFFNIMAYDIHGAWDSPKLIGAHSDIRVIRDTVEYMLDAGVPSHQIVVGMGTYGRTYTLTDPSCTTIGCSFSSAGPGGCAGESGFMPFFTIDEYVQSGNYNSLALNPTTASMELVVDGNIWISYDSQETFEMKASTAADMCLGGYMWWAVDMLKEPMVLLATATTVPTDTSAPVVAPIMATDAPTVAPIDITLAPADSPPVGDTPNPTSSPVDSPLEESPTASPVDSGGAWTVSTEMRCGASELDARGNCGAVCSHNSDCANNEWCWGVHDNYCNDKPVTKCLDLSRASSGFRCGLNELEAREHCGASCSTGTDCDFGESCVGVHTNTCDCKRRLRGN